MTTADKIRLLAELRLRMSYEDVRPQYLDPVQYEDLEMRTVDALAEIIDMVTPPSHPRLPLSESWWQEQAATFGFDGS